MSVLVRLGERLYEFETEKDLNTARSIYAQHLGSQNEFEEIMENENIDFLIDGDLYD